MRVALKWKGTALMFGPFVLAEVSEASRFTGHTAAYRITGQTAVYVDPERTFEETNAAARAEAEAKGGNYSIVGGVAATTLESFAAHVVSALKLDGTRNEH